MAIEIDHPLLFIGIGGTGGRIGAQLEKRLRDEIRGPDGARMVPGADLSLPHQLPSCFQFVYVDIDENDLGRLRDQVPGHGPAVARTMRTASKLLPSHRSYAEVRQFLHLRAEKQVWDWLPPAEGEPRVAPLSNGAGQLPTVGRACLFARIAEAGLGAAQEPVADAIDRLRVCAADLAALGGLNAGVCDVFVAFSVAGGTGNGMFYDYIHLVADAFRNTSIAIQIYPLVVMPSAFAEGAGGGRNAMLNAGRGLLDLSRLIDDQNMRDADTSFRLASAERSTGHSVTYRDRQALRPIQIEPSTLQTAFLFSRSAALTEAELHGSIVSFVLSMAGVRSEASAQDGHATGAQSSFINQGVDRQTLSPSGIGGRGMSTAAVASLSMPRRRVIRLLARRLLADAIGQADRVPPAEDNAELLDAFFHATGLTDLVTRQHLATRDAEHARNPKMRGLTASDEHEAHRAQAARRSAEMADQLDPHRGLAAMAARPGVDPFRAGRAMAAVTDFLNMNPVGVAVPTLPTRPGASEVRAWLNASADAAWVSAWAAQASAWSPKLSRVRTAGTDLTTALRDFREQVIARLDRDVADLFDDQATTQHFLHDLAREGTAFHQQLTTRLAESLGLSIDSAQAPVLLRSLLGTQRPWEGLITNAAIPAAEGRARWAITLLVNRIADRIGDQMAQDQSILPHLWTLLDPAENGTAATGPDTVRAALRGLVPTGLLMTAAGPAKVLITYPVPANAYQNATEPTAGTPSGPQVRRNPEVEGFIKDSIDIGSQPGAIHYEFRPTTAEFLTVVLMRTALGVTDIPEARQVMSLWADALRQSDVNDALRWRQRLGYDYGWLLTTEPQRVAILQHLLLAMRNGQVDVVSGTDEWPTTIAFRASAVPGSNAARLELPLRPWDEASPWADLLHAYEESILGGDELNRQEMYYRLMRATPVIDPATGRPLEAHPLYKTFLQVREEETEKLAHLLTGDELTGQLDIDQRLRVQSLLSFWRDTVPAARKKKIEGYSGLRNTLEALDAVSGQP